MLAEEKHRLIDGLLLPSSTDESEAVDRQLADR